MRFLRPIRALAILCAIGVAGVALLAALHAPRMIDPRTLDLGAMPGLGARSRLAALDDRPGACRAALDRAGVAFRPLTSRDAGECGFDDAVAWQADGSRAAHYTPATPPLACPLAAALAAWEWSVVQPAAAATFGTTVVGIDHFGSYACRRLYGRATGDWSEHARADAIDIAGFRLADGRHIRVATDWTGSSKNALFLHRVRDGACRLFGTTLSPDYNAAHRDHLHLDGARRGGWGVCR